MQKYAANEVCDKFAIAGFHSNLISYLTQELNMPLVSASNILTIYGGTASLTPLIGALIAESFAGRFWTITIASLIYDLVCYSTIFSYNIFFLHLKFYLSVKLMKA
ncbi:putative proton-dependent oligopeptide transporter family, major facilitator superfamily [Lupinus albus]|uniref:Putative proton-dependent oligopeptide transporter family, major facilitator superfamily n=1 Tax=Lupinus albus TaxID=3870 RepID=A0A6A4NM69_LUPAL|nr:putative proton-dependent oligopeptide transporter family, major facilitator superfamily [Lupinus albus]